MSDSSFHPAQPSGTIDSAVVDDALMALFRAVSTAVGAAHDLASAFDKDEADRAYEEAEAAIRRLAQPS